jgi:hypothetical protein
METVMHDLTYEAGFDYVPDHGVRMGVGTKHLEEAAPRIRMVGHTHSQGIVGTCRRRPAGSDKHYVEAVGSFHQVKEGTLVLNAENLLQARTRQEVRNKEGRSLQGDSSGMHIHFEMGRSKGWGLLALVDAAVEAAVGLVVRDGWADQRQVDGGHEPCHEDLNADSLHDFDLEMPR